MVRLASVPAFFLLRIAAGLMLLKLSASFLTVTGFTDFSQLLLFAALLNLIAIGGAQNGLIRLAAAADAAALSRVHGAALLIWGSIAPPLALLIAVESGRIARILVGSAYPYWAVIVIALIALAAGPGQIWCSILSGRKRVIVSLSAQGVGLVVGAAVAAGLIVAGKPFAATVGFATGPLVTMAIAWPFVVRLGLRRVSLRAARGEVPGLLTYSAAFAATASFSPILLFGLRAHYRAHFGAVALGYWLVANRISDISTQLLGLFLTQVFVPHFATLHNRAARRRLVFGCWAAAVAAMVMIPIVFWPLARPLVHLFLSDAYLPAIPAIRTYMIGDLLRVWASIAMFAAFARGRPGRYAAIEIGTLTLMAAITLVLITVGDPRAPWLGYVGAYGTTALIASGVFVVNGWRSGVGTATPAIETGAA